MKPAARTGDMHLCPGQTPPVPIPHVGGPVLPAPSTILIGGSPAATLGQMCVCTGLPDVIATGSMTVLLNNKPAARLGDSTAHGGTIISGMPSVLIGG
ncbi:PAAR domain-containing protein [Morganella psychrotolerans]|uniref:PAAR domain-containing protein n=1 Tax=Morganella psychrotolerans TaxID=368603 RepID=UPI0039B08956